MTRPRLALLNASYDEANTSRNFRRELAADLAEFDVTNGELPAGFDYEGVVVTGSKASVYWDEPWIEALLDWVGTAVERELPHLGVCYGHQVLAEALGGTVEAMDEYEIGYHEVHRVGESTVLGDLPEQFVVFTTHQDAVTELPPGARPTAENAYSNHGFERDHVFTVQFHPEYDKRTAELVTRGKDLEQGKLDAALDSITDANYAAACEAKRLFDAFTRYVRELPVDRPRTA
jgi:GMP synthase (glutamine-hydrolysing)